MEGYCRIAGRGRDANRLGDRHNIAGENVMAASVYAHIRNNPKFQQLVATRSRFAWTLAAVVLVIYYGFMSLVAFNPGWLAQSLNEGSIATIGWPIAAVMMFSFWLLTGLYVYRANGKFDTINAELISDATREVK